MKKLDIAAIVRCDGTGALHPDGSYVKLNIEGVGDIAISEGAAKVLIAELQGLLAKKTKK